jgi:FkbM family methyltransferase
MNGSKHEVRLLNAAAANRAGEMSLFVPIGHGMDATIASNWRPAAAFGSRQESVKVIALDEELDGQTPDFIKIDAEGAEPEVWDGMTRTWNRARPATLLEFNPARYADAAGFARRLFSEAAVSFVDVLGCESRLSLFGRAGRHAGQGVDAGAAIAGFLTLTLQMKVYLAPEPGLSISFRRTADALALYAPQPIEVISSRRHADWW